MKLQIETSGEPDDIEITASIKQYNLKIMQFFLCKSRPIGYSDVECHKVRSNLETLGFERVAP